MFYIGLRDSPTCSTYQSTYLETLGQNPLVCITLACGESTQRSVLNKTYAITTTLPTSLITGGIYAIHWQYYASVAVSINICFTLVREIQKHLHFYGHLHLVSFYLSFRLIGMKLQSAIMKQQPIQQITKWRPLHPKHSSYHDTWRRENLTCAVWNYKSVHEFW